MILLSHSSADSAHGFLAPCEPALIGVLSHAQSQMPVESSQGKTVWKSGVALGPLLFLILYGLKARRPASVELFEKSQCVRQIGELIHEVYLRQKCMPHVSELRLVPQPSGKHFAPGGGDLVNDASGAALGGRAAGSQQAQLLQPFQAWIDLAQFGGPEMSDPVVEDGLQAVSYTHLDVYKRQDEAGTQIVPGPIC